MIKSISFETKLQRNEAKFLISLIGDETIMMNLETGDYLGINNVGSDIWNQLETPKQINELIAYLTTTYEVPLEQCQSETMSYLSQLIEHQIVQVQS